MSKETRNTYKATDPRFIHANGTPPKFLIDDFYPLDDDAIAKPPPPRRRHLTLVGA